MAAEPSSLSLLTAGFGDGVVKVFDKRLEEEEAVVHLCGGHASWVQKVCWSPTQPKQFFSARYGTHSFIIYPRRDKLKDSAFVVWMAKSGFGTSGTPQEP